MSKRLSYVGHDSNYLPVEPKPQDNKGSDHEVCLKGWAIPPTPLMKEHGNNYYTCSKCGEPCVDTTPHSTTEADELSHIMGLCKGKHECWWTENIVGSDMDEQQIDWTIYGAIQALITSQLQAMGEEVIGEDEPMPIDGISSHARQKLVEQQRQRLQDLIQKRKG